MSRLHYAAESTGPLSTALCGILGSAVTTDHAAVTCRLCMSALAARINAGTVQPADASEALVDAILAGEATPAATEAKGARAPFVLDAERWRRLRDHCMCGSCDVCRRMLAIRVEQHSAPYEKRMRARTAETPARWSSPSAALETYVAHRLDGYPIKAWGGTLEQTRQLGCFVQQEGAFSSAAERAAQDVAHVEWVLRDAFAGGMSVAYSAQDAGSYISEDDAGRAERGEAVELPPLTASSATMRIEAPACIAILLMCGTGRLERVQAHGGTQQRYVPVPAEDVAAQLGMRVRDVEVIVREGRKRVGELLAARGLVARRAA